MIRERIRLLVKLDSKSYKDMDKGCCKGGGRKITNFKEIIDKGLTDFTRSFPATYKGMFIQAEREITRHYQN